MKACAKCGVSKYEAEFSKNARTKDGLQERCKDCVSAYMKQRIKERGSEVNQKRRIQYHKNAEKKRAQSRGSYARNAEKRKAYQKAYNANPEKRGIVTARRAAWKKRKLEQDPLFSIKHRMSCLLRVSLKAKGFGKTAKIADALGCSWEEFKLHIERQFLDGMSWDNRNLWHIDHIVPLAQATCEADIVRLTHHTNLRPLWAKDNLTKRDRLLYII